MMAQTTHGLKDNPSLQLLGSVVEIQTWNIALFYPIIMKMNPLIKWESILIELDHPDTLFSDQHSVAVVLKASNAVLQVNLVAKGKDMSLFPTNVFVEPWKNTAAQLGFLSNSIRFYPELFTKTQILKQKAISLDTPSRNNLTASIIASASTSPWNSIELVSLFVRLSEGPYGAQVVDILEYGLSKSPDLMLLAFAQLYSDTEKLTSQIADKNKEKEKRKPGFSPLTNNLEHFFVFYFVILTI